MRACPRRDAELAHGGLAAVARHVDDPAPAREAAVLDHADAAQHRAADAGAALDPSRVVLDESGEGLGALRPVDHMPRRRVGGPARFGPEHGGDRDAAERPAAAGGDHVGVAEGRGDPGGLQGELPPVDARRSVDGEHQLQIDRRGGERRAARREQAGRKRDRSTGAENSPRDHRTRGGVGRPAIASRRSGKRRRYSSTNAIHSPEWSTSTVMPCRSISACVPASA